MTYSYHTTNLPVSATNPANESRLHRATKELIASSSGKILKLPNVPLTRIVSGTTEVLLPGCRRIADAVVLVECRYSANQSGKEQPLLWQGNVIIEVCVTSPKDSQWVEDIKNLGMPAFQFHINQDLIWEMTKTKGSKSTKTAIETRFQRYSLEPLFVPPVWKLDIDRARWQAALSLGHITADEICACGRRNTTADAVCYICQTDVCACGERKRPQYAVCYQCYKTNTGWH